jgi:hypothetical protein
MSMVHEVTALLQHWSCRTVVTTDTVGASAAVKGRSKKTTWQVGKGGRRPLTKRAEPTRAGMVLITGTLPLSHTPDAKPGVAVEPV